MRGWIGSKIRFEDRKFKLHQIADIREFLSNDLNFDCEVLPRGLLRSTGTLAGAAGRGTHHPCCWPFEGGRPTPK